MKHIKILNNIVKGTRSYGFLTFMDTGIGDNYVVKNNLLYQNSNNNVSLQNGASLPTNWTYSGNIVANPQLDAAFYPLSTSSAINAGVKVGLPYTGSAPDIGVYSFHP